MYSSQMLCAISLVPKPSLQLLATLQFGPKNADSLKVEIVTYELLKNYHALYAEQTFMIEWVWIN